MYELYYWITSDSVLPIVFLVLMGISMLVYALLDGYDLGVGILMLNRPEWQRDQMIASIGPFWDANETWLVLGVGILLVAFPVAHGVVLGTLYIPVVLMLAGLILRGVSFDFRAKAGVAQVRLWDLLFGLGSLLTSATQGYMLGQYIIGFSNSFGGIVFSILSAVCVTCAYVLIGACWLVLKTQDELKIIALKRAKLTVPLVGCGLLAVSIVNPLVSDRIASRWLSFPEVLWLSPLPLLSAAMLYFLYRNINGRLDDSHISSDALPFLIVVALFVMSFIGLAYSFYPYVVPNQLTAWDAASAPESLRVIFYGVVVVLPAIIAYTALSYWIFRGKAQSLRYV